MHVLLVEDDNELAAQINRGLTQAGFIVERAVDGDGGYELGLQPQKDTIILDLELSGKPGLDVLKDWRARGVVTPVLMLAAHDAWIDRVGVLDDSVDDYLIKPFHLPELVARLHALRRRSWDHASNVLKHEGLTVNLATGEVTRGDEPLELTALELRMLKYFMNRTRHVISHSELVEHLYNNEDMRRSNMIEVYVSRLRRKIGADRIKTLRGLGYRFG